MGRKTRDLGYRLNPRQHSIIREITAYIAVHGFPPTSEEVAKVLDLPGQTVRDNMIALGRCGFIVREVGKSRSTRIEYEAVRMELLAQAVLSALRGEPTDGLSPSLVEALKAEAKNYKLKL